MYQDTRQPLGRGVSDYGGTIDVASTRTRRPPPNLLSIKRVALGRHQQRRRLPDRPRTFSDVTIFMDAATRYAYVVNFSHVDILRLNARTETVIGVTEMEELDPENDSSPDYDELETTGNETSTHYTPTAVTTTVRNDKDKEATTVIDAESITHTVDKSEVRQTADKVVQKVNSTTVAVADNKVTLGDENATEPLVLGNELARLMLDFLTECSKIMTPTLMGTMSPINMPNFISLTSRIQKFLSKTSYTK